MTLDTLVKTAKLSLFRPREGLRHVLGSMTKGRGTLPQAIAMMAWFEALMIAISLVQTVVMLVFPPLGLLLVPAMAMMFPFGKLVQGYAPQPIGALLAFGLVVVRGRFLVSPELRAEPRSSFAHSCVGTR